jgi:preprotein translocase subunit YajC
MFFNVFQTIFNADVSGLSCLSGASGNSGSSGGFGGSWMTLLLPLLLVVVMIVVMIIPQRRRDKKVKDMLGSLKQGDRVRTIGGIYGTISSIKDDVIILSVGPDKVKLVFARGAISQVEDAGVENTMSEEIKD